MAQTASEQIVASFRGIFTQLAGLGMQELGINFALSALVAGLAFALGLAFRRLVHIGVRKAAEAAETEAPDRPSRVARLSRLIVSWVLVIGAFLAIARVWGLDVGSLLAQGVGERLVQLAGHIALLLVLGLAAFELAGFLVERLLGGLMRATSDLRRTAQLRTLEPLLRSFARGVVLVIFAMMVLSELGVKIGPLLAGAGVVGIAVGFGAQTLVKDLLTGLFLIVEDIVSIGDIVNIQGSGGLVEEMTLRTIRLRDFDGTLHIFPYGEAQVIHNLTKNFSYYVFDPQISYESDIDRAIEIMRQTGDGLQADPAFADKILAPIEVVGVDKLADSGIVLKARIKTRPIEQWNVGREYNRRLKLAFDQAGIQIPYPHIKLVLPTSDASPPQPVAARGSDR